MHSVSRPVRRLATILTSIGLAVIVATGSVLAGTPVSVGWRDHVYSGGATRPSSDKPQSKLWYTDEGGSAQWWGGMFYPGTSSAPRSEFRIFKLSPDKSTWTATNTVLDTRDGTHGDYLFDQTASTLFVASVANPNVTAPFVASVDGIRIYKATYNDTNDTYANVAGFPVTIPGTASTASPEFRGGAWTVSIDRDTSGRLWAAWPKDQQVMYSTSDDGGVTWTTAAVLPAQGANTINKGTISSSDTATVIAFGNGSKDTIGVAWSDQDSSETAPGSGVNGNGYYFATIAAGADPTVEANWTKTKLPAPPGLGTIYADNHINIKATSDGTIYMVGKARTDTTQCATLKDRLLIPFYRRTAAGSWGSAPVLAGTAGDCDTRPQVVIDEQLTPDVAYIFLTSPNGGGAIYRKAAPLSGSQAFDFRGSADTITKRGVTFIRSSTETLIDDASTTKQVVNSESGIAVIANNLTSSTTTNKKFYLHNFMTLPASDNTPPVGTAVINGGATTTDSSTVTMTVSATDTNGSGMALVRLSNSNAVDGNGVLNGAGSTSYTYTPTITWNMSAGLGTQTVYAQWRDAAGKWSNPVSDTIEVVDDTTPPIAPASVSYTLAGDGRQGIPVKLSWTAGSDNKGVQGYRIFKQVNGGAVTTSDVPATPLFSYLELPKSAANYKFCVRTIDTANRPSTTGRCVSFNTAAYSESSGALKYSSGWGLTSSPVYVGGQAKYSKTAGRSVTFTFTGNRFAWLSRIAPANGSAKVYVDGVLSKTVSLYGTTAVNQKVAYSKSWSSIGTHTIKIVVSGTAGHPTVIVDQLYVLK